MEYVTMTRKRQRFNKKTGLPISRPISIEEFKAEVRRHRVGDKYAGSVIKSIKMVDGVQCPTKAYYDDGKPIESSEKGVGRAVLENGMIHYLKPNTFRA
jgi:hypothetical protein